MPENQRICRIGAIFVFQFENKGKYAWCGFYFSTSQSTVMDYMGDLQDRILNDSHSQPLKSLLGLNGAALSCCRSLCCSVYWQNSVRLTEASIEWSRSLANIFHRCGKRHFLMAFSSLLPACFSSLFVNSIAHLIDPLKVPCFRDTTTSKIGFQLITKSFRLCHETRRHLFCLNLLCIMAHIKIKEADEPKCVDQERERSTIIRKSLNIGDRKDSNCFRYELPDNFCITVPKRRNKAFASKSQRTRASYRRENGGKLVQRTHTS